MKSVKAFIIKKVILLQEFEVMFYTEDVEIMECLYQVSSHPELKKHYEGVINFPMWVGGIIKLRGGEDVDKYGDWLALRLPSEK